MLSIISHLHNANALDCCSVDCHTVLRAEQSNGYAVAERKDMNKWQQWWGVDSGTTAIFILWECTVHFMSDTDAIVEMFWSTWISSVAIHSINLFHMECLVSPQGHFSYVHTEQSFAFSHPSARGADVSGSSWAPHPWLDLAQPASSEATWHPGWPSKHASPVGRRSPGFSLYLQLCAAAAGDVYFNPATGKTKPLCMLFSHSALSCCNFYFENSMRSFWG